MLVTRENQGKEALSSCAFCGARGRVSVKKFLFLTSMFAIGSVYSAMAEEPIVVPAGQFPDIALGEYMQPNRIYKDSAVAENMDGVSSGTVIAEAIYVDEATQKVTCNPGYYLTANATSCDAACPANSYCEGGEYYVGDLDQGTKACNVLFADSGTEPCDVTNAVSATRAYTRTCYHRTSPANSISSNACTGTDACAEPTYGTCYVDSCNTGYHKNSVTQATLCLANTYSVKYNANGGSGTMLNSEHTYGVEKALTANVFTNGTKRFLGWAITGTAVAPAYTDTQSVKNLTADDGETVDLYAIWGSCTECNAGSGANCELSVVNNTCTYATSCKTGYSNIQNNNEYNPSCSLNTYTIAYNLNGGENYAGAPTSYTVETDTITLEYPSKTGHVFGGWYNNSALSGAAVSQIVKGSTGNKSFWAKWTPESYVCAAGQYLPAGETSCSTCLPGNYCTGGTYTYSAESAHGLTACENGYVSAEGSDEASDCHSGSATSNTVTCDAGTYLPANATNCVVCPEDSYCEGGTYVYPLPNAQGIAACTNGQVSASGSTSVSACHNPKVTCAAGTYLPANATNCVVCPENSYCEGGSFDNPLSNAQGIAACTNGQVSASGSTSVSACHNPKVTCASGTYLPANATNCVVCPENSYCEGGAYVYPLSNAQGISACASGKVSPQGTTTAGGCGKMMYVDNTKLYLTTEKQTTPALAVKVDGVVYYANVTALSNGAKSMNSGTTKSLRTRIDGVEYSIHDNTVQGE